MEMEKIVHSFRKNDVEEVRVTLRQYKERVYVDIRIFFESQGQFLPRNKGLTLSAEFLPELKRGIEKAVKEAPKFSRIS